METLYPNRLAHFLSSGAAVLISMMLLLCLFLSHAFTNIECEEIKSSLECMIHEVKC